jgi:DNA-binding NtrC family response regulator
MSSDTSAKKILAVDDNHEALFALEQLLVSQGFEVVTASSGAETLRVAEAECPDLILLDVMMPAPNGYEVAKSIKSHPELRYATVVLLTGRDELSDILYGLDQGADDYICKPYDSDELIARVHAAIRLRALHAELRDVRSAHRHLQAQVRGDGPFDSIIGESPVMRELYQMMAKVVDAEVPLLITGESGTGKEVVATALHLNGPRKDKAFVVQNCSAFNENLLESELFGHVKGAFTGATRDKQGLFEVADKGTFFLDELGEMSPALQVKLLRVLQDGTFMPVGGTKQKQVDVRVIAATNRNLEDMVAKGTFREDLYYRLNVVNIALPPLRERDGDIPLLIGSFLDRLTAKSHGDTKRIDPAALQLMERYSWPGNIRQLENEVQRAFVMSGGEAVITVEHLSPALKDIAVQNPGKGEPVSGSLKDAVSQVERTMIKKVLEECEGNKSESARRLSISRSNLIAKCHEYGLD